MNPPERFRATIEIELNGVMYGIRLPLDKRIVTPLTIDISSPITVHGVEEVHGLTGRGLRYQVHATLYECIYQVNAMATMHQKRWRRCVKSFDVHEWINTGGNMERAVEGTLSSNRQHKCRLSWTPGTAADTIVVEYGSIELTFPSCPLFFLSAFVLGMDCFSLDNLRSLMHQEPNEQWHVHLAVAEYVRDVQQNHGLDTSSVYLGMIRTGYNTLKTFLDRVDAQLVHRHSLIQTGHCFLPVSAVWLIVMNYIQPDDQCAAVVTVRDRTGKDTVSVPPLDEPTMEPIRVPRGGKKRKARTPDIVVTEATATAIHAASSNDPTPTTTKEVS